MPDMARKGIQKMKQFNQAVIDFNRMYGLPTPTTPTISGAGVGDRLDLIKRLGKFKLILSEEIDEVHDLQMSINRGANDLDTLTSWLIGSGICKSTVRVKWPSSDLTTHWY